MNLRQDTKDLISVLFFSRFVITIEGYYLSCRKPMCFSLSPLSIRSISFFSRLAANDRGYGHWRSAGVFPVVKRQKEMRAQRQLNARQPANEHRCVMACSLFSVVLYLIVYI